MESKRVQRLKLTMHLLAFNLFTCFFTTALLVMMPIVVTAATFNVNNLPDSFFPPDITIHPGDTVLWTNTTGVPHTITGDPGGSQGPDSVCQETLDGLLLNAGGTYSHTFVTLGDCHYICLFHYGMKGVIHVVPACIPTPDNMYCQITTTFTTTTTTSTTTTTTTTTTTLPNQPPSAVSLTPVNISTVPGTAQSFTAVYSDPDGWQNISDASLALSGSTHSELLHYSPATNKFILVGASGDCSPGNGATLTNGFLNLNCGTSNISGSGNTLTLTINLTPQPPLSGAAYRLIMAVVDQGGSNVNKDMGYWVVNRRPNADSVTPMTSTTPPGNQQTFVSIYSDPDGYQNIAEANFYLAGGLINQWLHYLSAPNLFTMMGTNEVCFPGEMKMLSNGFLTLDCATSSVSGSGTTLTVTFRVTPHLNSYGNYNIFTGVSDHAGAAHGLFAGLWQIPVF